MSGEARGRFARQPQRQRGGKGRNARQVKILGPARQEVGIVDGREPGEAEAGRVGGRAIDRRAGLGAGRQHPMPRAAQPHQMDLLGAQAVAGQTKPPKACRAPAGQRADSCSRRCSRHTWPTCRGRWCSSRALARGLPSVENSPCPKRSAPTTAMPAASRRRTGPRGLPSRVQERLLALLADPDHDLPVPGFRLEQHGGQFLALGRMAEQDAAEAERRAGPRHAAGFTTTAPGPGTPAADQDIDRPAHDLAILRSDACPGASGRRQSAGRCRP